jgi:hypothetical protein
MRLLSTLLLLLVAGRISSLPAQERPFSITAFAAYVAPSPIYQHETRRKYDAYEDHNSERLTVADAPAAGARLEYRRGRAWTGYVEASYAPSDMEFDQQRVVSQSDTVTSYEAMHRSGRASIAGLGLGVRRWIGGPPHLPELGLSVGGAWQRFRLEHRERECSSPSQGFTCQPADPWEAKYDLPSVTGSLAVRQRWRTRFAVEIRTAGALGRANTEGFWKDLVPEHDEYEAPRSQWVRTAEAALGISVRL